MMSYIGVYVVALGRTIRDSLQNSGKPPGNLWCQVQFQRPPPIKKLKLMLMMVSIIWKQKIFLIGVK